jgi:hypothetical protein
MIHICDINQMWIIKFHILLPLFTQLCMDSYMVQMSLVLEMSIKDVSYCFVTIVQCIMSMLNLQLPF